jgi:hypothetical protein
VGFEVPEDKNEVVSPKHDVIASDVKHKKKEVSKVVGKIQELCLVNGKSLEASD